jgi:putative flippase GtrA
VSFLRGLVAHPEFRRLFRFGLTGIASFVVDFGILVLAHDGFGWPLRAALVAAYTLGGVVHYSLTRWWVFPTKHSGGGAAEAGRVIRYLLLAAVNTVATLLIVPGLAGLGVDYRVAKVICVVLLFGFNYLVTPRFVMPREPRSPAPTEA